MKASSILTVVAIATLSGAAGFFAARESSRQPSATQATPASNPGSHGTERKVLFYQSGMHPWIKSDKPGKCTICGMPLTPIYEGDKSLDLPPGSVGLNPGSILALNVQTSIVHRQTLSRTLKVAGTIDDNDTTHRRLSATIEGRIEKLAVPHVGAEVVRGELLASFHSPMLLGLQKEYITLHRQLANAPTSNRTELETLMKAAERRLFLVGMTSSQIEALARQPDDAHLVDILAPISGTVVSKEVYEGQYVKEGDKLFELADFSVMWFRFDVYEKDLPFVRQGQKVEITTTSLPGRVFTGPIAFVDPNFNEATRSTKAWVEIPNPIVEKEGVRSREILHRLYAEGIIRVEVPDVLTVPRSAVLNPDGRPMVYIALPDGLFQQRRIKLGRIGENDWEVIQGVKEGERVVTHGNLLIDSQAQLNNGIATDSTPPSSTHASQASSASLPALTPPQRDAASQLIQRMHRLGQALAKDDLDRFNQEAAQVDPTRISTLSAFDNQEAWQRWLKPIRELSAIKPASTLESARAAFLPWSSAVVEWALPLKRQTGFNGIKLFQCPMTNKAFPGAPKSASWLQTDGPISNPYFGASMPDCGTEIEP